MLQSKDAGTETLQSEQFGYEKASLKEISYSSHLQV